MNHFRWQRVSNKKYLLIFIGIGLTSVIVIVPTVLLVKKNKEETNITTVTSKITTTTKMRVVTTKMTTAMSIEEKESGIILWKIKINHH